MGKANFTEDFKRDAVLQVTERGYPVAEVAARLGISEGIGMVLLLSNGDDPIWFGVLLVVNIGLIHPPVGTNLFVIAPFVLIAMLLAWPEVALWLPRSMSLN